MGRCKKHSTDSCEQCCVLAGRIKCTVNNLTGPTGPRGPTGLQGAQGAAGIQGPTGPGVDATTLTYVEPIILAFSSYTQGEIILTTSGSGTSDSTDLIYTDEKFDTINTYNAASSQFIVPETGAYEFNAIIITDTIIDPNNQIELYFELLVNGTVVKSLFRNEGGTGATRLHGHYHLIDILELDSNNPDIVSFRLRMVQTIGSDTVNTRARNNEEDVLKISRIHNFP
jgi:hypothetical protein